MTQNFVTIFPTAQNVHLIKDVGQLANALGDNFYISKLVCYKNSETYSYLESEASNLIIDFIEREGRFLFLEKAVLRYIKRNAKTIDVLNLYHLTKESVYYGLYFMYHNKSGKVYLKMDVYNDSLLKDVVFSKKIVIQKIHQYFANRFFKKLDVISVENPIALKIVQQSYPLLSNKVMLITNGINDKFLGETFPIVKTIDEKENIILSVGRIGAPDKNFEMLLNAFAKANLPNWNLIFVGPIENEFDKKVEKLIAESNLFSDRIKLIGNVLNRKEFYEYYNRSKICCLTSPFESFGIVFIEAMYFGNYVIGTNGMSSFNYITDNLRLGSCVDVNDENSLINLMEQFTQDENKLKLAYSAAQERVKEKFCWSKIVKPLVGKLNN